jgi:hypothetical protein
MRSSRRFMARLKPTTALFGEMDGFDISSKPEKSEEPKKEEPKVSPIESVEPVEEEEIAAPPAPMDLSDDSISNSMRDKLKQELQAQGAYSNKKSSNPILIIGAVVAVAVIVGGQGFFY